MKFEISVIIPVFNAEKYILKAINSVLHQPEVMEILIINDGSTDETAMILDKIKKADSRIKLLSHPSGMNLGRSASRNLGIQNASYAFIAFLDADDYYLPNRFKPDKKIFKENPDADGVYNAIGAEFYTQADNSKKNRLKLTTLKKYIEPESLFYEMWPKGYSGSFSIDGLTVKKKIFEKSGVFNEELKVAEDTELFIKMALKARLYSGELRDPVSIRGLHDRNVTHLVGENIYVENYFTMYQSLLLWGSKNEISIQALDYFWERLHQHFKLLKGDKNNLYYEISFWLFNGIQVPRLFETKRFLKAFPLFNRIKELWF